MRVTRDSGYMITDSFGLFMIITYHKENFQDVDQNPKRPSVSLPFLVALPAPLARSALLVLLLLLLLLLLL